MTHLNMEALLGLREPGVEPGDGVAQRHIEECELCRAELERLHQRAARLKALPALRPSRDLWPAVSARQQLEHRHRRTRWTSVAGLMAAASIAGVLLVKQVAQPPTADAMAQIEVVKARSQALESALDAYNPDSRVIDGRTARMSQELEDRIGVLDRQLETAQLRQMRQSDQDQQQRMLELWRERVGLLDALVDVHVTRASNVGL